jgi:deoxyribonuclease V
MNKNNMLNHELLQANISFEEAIELQEKYYDLLSQKNIETLNIRDFDAIRWIVGVDVTYNNSKNDEYGIACAVLWDFKLDKLKEYKIYKGPISFPYVAGLLGFRECEMMVKSILKLGIKPDIIISDGHGQIHPRRFGEATQLGMILDVPTFGVAKNPFIGTSDWKQMKRIKGEKTPVLDSKELVGYAICLGDKRKPVFVSEGYKIQIELALKITLSLSKDHRQPEPLYLADHFSRKELRA